MKIQEAIIESGKLRSIKLRDWKDRENYHPNIIVGNNSTWFLNCDTIVSYHCSLSYKDIMSDNWMVYDRAAVNKEIMDKQRKRG